MYKLDLFGLKTMTRIVAAAALALALGSAQAFDPWVVRNFEVEGAQRISTGTIYNYLPLNIGDTVTDQRVQESIRALYSTGFFQDVEFRRDADTLVIAVLERPSIEEFTIEGNDEIKTEDLEESLRQVGLTRGKVFDRSVLDEVRQFLLEQYYSRGRYGVTVETPVEDIGDNRVRVGIEINEGARAKIQQINLVGNTSFTDREILGDFELSTGNWLSFIRNDDRYSKEALEGDLEALRSFYMDRGFADFRWESIQVAISPDKQDIFVTVNIFEGDRYTISDVQLAGDLVVPENQLRSLIYAQPGQLFSQQLIAASEEYLTLRLGQDGYGFAQVQAVPELNEETKEVAITFFVDPRNRVYVRRINFNGADSVNDEVFRREMRQLEGSYLSNALLERSKIRLQRLPYIETVEFETIGVPGSADLVDINFEVEEGLPGQFGGGIGFSEYYGLQLNGNFVHSNFMGTGNRVGVDLSGGEYYKVYSVSFTDPYRTIDELSRTLSIAYRDIRQFTSATSDFSTQTITASADWSYPITEMQYIRFGTSLSQAQMVTGFYSSQQANEWVRNHGNPFEIEEGPYSGTTVRTVGSCAGLVLRLPQSCDLPDARVAPECELERVRSGQRGRVLHRFVGLYAVHSDFRRLDDQAQLRVGLGRALRRGDPGASAVPQLLCRRAGHGPWIQGKLARAAGLAVQSSRWQSVDRQSIRVGFPVARTVFSVSTRGAFLRCRQRISHRRRKFL